MSLYLLSDPQEIGHLPWRERERILQAAGERWSREHRVWALIVSTSSLSFMITAMIVGSLGFGFSGSPDYRASCSLLAGALTLVSVFQKVFFLIFAARTRRRALQEQMREDGVRPARCFQCRADLTSAEGNACPQCHTRLVAPRCLACGQPTPGA